jgi:hypothetical protein
MPNLPVRRLPSIRFGLPPAGAGDCRVCVWRDRGSAVPPRLSRLLRLRPVATALMSLAIAACSSGGLQSVPVGSVATSAASQDLCSDLQVLEGARADLARAYAAAKAGDADKAAEIGKATLPRVLAVTFALRDPGTPEGLALSKTILAAGDDLTSSAQIFTGLSGPPPSAADMVRLFDQVNGYLVQVMAAAEKVAVSGTTGLGGLCPPFVTPVSTAAP